MGMHAMHSFRDITETGRRQIGYSAADIDWNWRVYVRA
jgi:hypothetical protein